jgi:uncharacterized membrane protein SpoIIM required for sporulation
MAHTAGAAEALAPKGATMRERRFVGAAKPRWDRLESLVARVDRHGIRSLDHTQIDNLALDYRAVTSDLAMARSRGYDNAIVDYLNRLSARAHAYVYLGTSRSGWAAVRRFLWHTFPSEMRRSWLPIGTCAAVTIVCSIIAYTAVITEPANAYALLSPAQIPAVTSALHDTNFGFDRAFAPLVSSEIITNNIRVAAVAAAGGMTCGSLTLWIILENGLMLGGVGALFAHANYGLDFWATIAPHGVIELSAIQVAGGAGLLLAAAIVAPGRVRRVDALVRNAQRAGVLVLGTAALLIVAGLIEGFVSPQRLGPAVRIALGALTAIGLALYVTFAGRSRAPQRAETAPDLVRPPWSP